MMSVVVQQLTVIELIPEADHESALTTVVNGRYCYDYSPLRHKKIEQNKLNHSHRENTTEIKITWANTLQI